MSLRSRPYDTFISRPLSDRAIEEYALQGRYGPVKQARAELAKMAREKRRAKRQSASARPANMLSAQALKDLLDI